MRCFRINNADSIKQLHHLEKCYFELGQVFEILSHYYAVPVFIQITNIFFDILMNSYIVVNEVFKFIKVHRNKYNADTTCPHLMLICLNTVNFSTEGNFFEYKSQFDSLTNGTSLDTTSLNYKETEVSRHFIIYASIKLLFLIVSFDALAKCKTATLNILKR